MLMETVADTLPSGSRRTYVSCQEPCASIPAVWHCAYTKPSKEASCDRALRRQGFATYLPLYQLIWRDRTKIIRPLFPRYTFVLIPADAPWRATIRDSVGRDVGELMLSPTTRQPLVVPDAVVAALQGQAGADGVIYPPQPRQMAKGDVGRVLDGPLAGFAGICSRAAKDRVWLLLSLLGREQAVPFRREMVEVAA